MTETRVPGRDGTITVIGTPQSISVGPNEPPDDPAKYARKELTEDEVKARFRWTGAQFETARDCLGFPKGTKRIKVARFSMVNREVMYYPVSQIDAWVERMQLVRVK